MEDLKIFTTYAAGLFALAFSVTEINEYLKFLVLIVTLSFYIIEILKSFKK